MPILKHSAAQYLSRLPTWLTITIVLSLAFPTMGIALHQPSYGYVFDVRSIELSSLGISNPAGLAYSPARDMLLVLDGSTQPAGGSELKIFDYMREELAGSSDLPLPIRGTVEAAFDDRTNSLYLFDRGILELIQIQYEDTAGPELAVQGITRQDTSTFGLQQPRGMALAPDGEELLFVDSRGASIVHVPAGANGKFDIKASVAGGQVSETVLSTRENLNLQSLAIEPNTGHAFMLEPTARMLYEFNASGVMVSVRDLSAYDLENPTGMVFAPSGDFTDDPEEMSLYIADSDEILELSLTAPAMMDLPLAPSAITLVQTTYTISTTATWDPYSSPDPMGIGFNHLTGELIISDSEIEENPAGGDPPYWQGANVFVTNTDGTLVSTGDVSLKYCNTLYGYGFSDEPVGVAVHSTNGHIFFSDDGQDEVFELDLGGDGVFCTSDDVVTHFDTRVFGNIGPPDTRAQDPEGIAFGQGKLFISDGVNKEVYVLSPGSNGVFDGLPGPPDNGDDVLETQFDTEVIGQLDPEGIGYNAQRGTLFIAGRNPITLLLEVTTSGALVASYNFPDISSQRPSGVAVGPGSQDPDVFNIYISDRGVDNDTQPLANDGRVHEFDLGDEPTAVTLASFEVNPVGGYIQVQWETLIEIDVLGFNLYRSESPGGDRIQLNAELIPSESFEPFAGGSYEFIDDTIQPSETYYYWLQAVEAGNPNGAAEMYGPVEATAPFVVFLPLVEN